MSTNKVNDKVETKPNRKESSGDTVTVAELAKYLNISKASVYSKIYAGTLDVPYVQMGKMLRFVKTDVEDWLNRKREESLIKNCEG